MKIDWLDRVPTTLDECFKALDQMINKDEIEKFRNTPEKDCHYGHFGIGMWMRNNWSLWTKEGLLNEWFNHIGIWHGDDKSSIILTSYHRYLNSKFLYIDEQVKHYRDYWDRVQPSVNRGEL